MGWYNGEWVDTYGDPCVAIKYWCPQCDPDGIPEPYTLQMCSTHCDTSGTMDRVVMEGRGSFWASGAGDGVGSEGNSAWCNLIHRKSA